MLRGRPSPSTGRRSWWSDRGAAAVEFLLVLPVLLMLLFGIIDFGRMLYTKITLTQAAEATARATAIMGKPGGLSEADAATSDLDKSDGAFPTPQITACKTPPDPNSNATATLTYKFHFATPLSLFAPSLGSDGNGVTLSSTSVSPCVG